MGDALTVNQMPETIDGAKDSSESVLSFLLQSSNSYMNYQDNYGSTPLHYAAVKGNPRAVEELLKDGRCDVNVRRQHC